MPIKDFRHWLEILEKEGEVAHITEKVDWDLEMIEKGGYPHFMLKEIFEQPETIRDAIRGRVIHEAGEAHLGGLAEPEIQ